MASSLHSESVAVGVAVGLIAVSVGLTVGVVTGDTAVSVGVVSALDDEPEHPARAEIERPAIRTTACVERDIVRLLSDGIPLSWGLRAAHDEGARQHGAGITDL
jgi:hypothetical protein